MYKNYSMIIKQGDLEPPIVANLTYKNNNYIPIEHIDNIRLIITEEKNRNNVFVDSDDIEILDRKKSKVMYQWKPGDTEFAGSYQLEFLVTLKNGNQITVPNQCYEYIYIDKRLGDKLVQKDFPKVIVKYEEFLPDREIKYLKSLNYNVQLVCLKYEDLFINFDFNNKVVDSIVDQLEINYDLSVGLEDQLEQVEN